jgi:hypothetical protein
VSLRTVSSSLGYQPTDVRLRCLGQSPVTALTSADLRREIVSGLLHLSRLSLYRCVRFTNRFTEPVLDLWFSELPRVRTRARSGLSVHPVTVGRPHVERARTGGFTDRHSSSRPCGASCGNARGLDQRLHRIPPMSHTVRIGPRKVDSQLGIGAVGLLAKVRAKRFAVLVRPKDVRLISVPRRRWHTVSAPPRRTCRRGCSPGRALLSRCWLQAVRRTSAPLCLFSTIRLAP